MSEQVFKCDSLCVHYQKRTCHTMEEDGLCDEPYNYKEIGTVIDNMLDRAREDEYEQK